MPHSQRCVALLPQSIELDEEAILAAACFPTVLRFSAVWSDDDATCAVSVFAGPGRDGAPWKGPTDSEMVAVHRGFLLPALHVMPVATVAQRPVPTESGVASVRTCAGLL